MTTAERGVEARGDGVSVSARVSDARLRWHRRRHLARCASGVVAVSALLVSVRVAGATGLLVPTAGAADIAISGSNVAEPRSASAAQFANPAGLAAFTEPAVQGGPGLVFARGEVTADSPPGYHKTNDMVVILPDLGVVYPIGRWTLGWSVHGSSGSRYDYGAEPSVGVNDGFFSENAILAGPLGVAYRVSDELWLGAEIIPLYSMTHLKYTRPWVSELAAGPVPFRFKVSGPGVQALFGVTWKPHDRWSFGFSFRPPGRIWTDGDMSLPSGAKQDVELEIEAPSVVSLGINRKLGERLTLSYGFRWTDASEFSDSHFRFEQTPSADGPYMYDAHDEWRHALGAEFALTDRWTLRGGTSRGTAIVGNKGVNPMSYDVEDFSFSSGAGYRRGRWTVDSALVFMVGAERKVPAADALVFPGTYEAAPAVMIALTITRRF